MDANALDFHLRVDSYPFVSIRGPFRVHSRLFFRNFLPGSGVGVYEALSLGSKTTTAQLCRPMRTAVLAALSIGVLMATGKIAPAQSVTIDVPILNQTLVASNNQTLSLNGDGKPRVITGDNNKIQIHGDCSSLKVIGNSNMVEVERVGDIQMIGGSNRVSYVHTLNGETPTIANIGQDNEAKQVAAIGSDNAPAPSSEDTSDVQLVTLTNDNQTRPINKPHVKLVGSNNSLVFTGVAQQLEIEGSNNDVEIDQVTKVIFHGSNNDVTYKQPLSSGEVVSEAHGSNNDVEKAE
jgi:Protein of unknown function (DUF3060)